MVVPTVLLTSTVVGILSQALQTLPHFEVAPARRGVIRADPAGPLAD